MIAKEQLRKQALGLRSALGAEERAAKSRAITAALERWTPYNQAGVLCLYVSFGSEADTWDLLFRELSPLTASTERRPCLCLPRVEGPQLVLHRLQRAVASGLVGASDAVGRGTAGAIEGSAAAEPAVDGDRIASVREHGSAAAGSLQSAPQPRQQSAPQPRQQCAPQSRQQSVPQSRQQCAQQPVSAAVGSAQGAPSCRPLLAAETLAALGLVRSPMGMFEPVEGLPVVQPSHVELILLPGSAFSSKGHRMGYGKGFYDRLLQQMPQALKVGVGFDAQIFAAETFPSEPHDVMLDFLVTESGVHSTR